MEDEAHRQRSFDALARRVPQWNLGVSRLMPYVWLEGDATEEPDARSGAAWADEVELAIARLGELPVEPATDREPTRPAPTSAARAWGCP